MRVTLRLVASLVLAASLVVGASTAYQARREKTRMTVELDRRGGLLAESLRELAAPLAERKDAKGLSRLVKKYGGRERLMGLAVFGADGRALAVTGGLEGVEPVPVPDDGTPVCSVLPGPPPRRACAAALPDGGGSIVVVHDASSVEARMSELWRHNFLRLLIQALLIVAVTLWVVRWDLLAPAAALADWMRRLRAEGADAEPPASAWPFAPLASEAARLGRSLTAARAAAEEEARLRHQSVATWTPERLKGHSRDRLHGKPLFVVANREPYLHVRRANKIEVLQPASGLVTGVEPILKACGGTWVAHGAGDADRETVDAQDRVKVPPDEPRYTLKRVWLTKEEEDGYYFGFSNEGLWPLCHIAHARPSFRAEDWRQYQAVNRKFADALLKEMEGVEEPCVLIQDYHFALLPRLIKEARPDARVSLFWHIPWPNPEAFGICPWQRDIIDGMLGADVLGFHIQYHCNNFLETVDRALESRIDWANFSVRRGGHETLVKPYPISVAMSEASDKPPTKADLLKEAGATGDILALGVDRIDYTKGIIERLLAVERFLEKNPAYLGRFVFVELGAPSRVNIARYRDLGEEVKREAERINARFGTRVWKPVIMNVAHHGRAEIERWYRAADVCLVTSLHDGMNLVAKEYVASSREEPGVLILSRFAGAARELSDALIVNPYDAEKTADALLEAVEMAPAEKERRWVSMRDVIREHNIFRWGARLIDDLARVRPGV
ncbi:MAG: trehalose-6-phosphate synthase [Elusimicrobia bacterium]|nr:trehalose-6-phosphate synthase [Elusimicrobiota bacterium]